MKNKRIIVIAVLVVGGLLVCLAAVLLFRGLLTLRREQDALDRAKRDMSRVYERDPFPSSANIEIERQNVALLRGWHTALSEALRGRNIVSQEDSPSRFIRNYEDAKRLLALNAQQRGVALTAGPAFAFGFDPYSGTGVLPQREHVPVLSEQLLIIERICNLIFDSGIRSLASVGRDPVASDDVMPPSGGTRTPGLAGGPAPSSARVSRPAVRQGEYYSRLQFRFDFTATEAAFLKVMNALAADGMFVMVDAVSFEKRVPEMVPVIETPAAAAQVAVADDDDFFQMGVAVPTPKPTPDARPVIPIWRRDRDQRVISGPAHETPLQVTLTVSVYKFKGE